VPILGIALDELYQYLGETLPPERLEEELHRFGSSVEGWAELGRWRCPRCGAVTESAEPGTPPVACDGCGADLREIDPPAEDLGTVRVLKMELLAVRPDLFDPPGLARALRGFLGMEEGAPEYLVETGDWSIEVDPALAGPDVVRPRIVAATVHDVDLDEARLRSLMKLQENVHWALGRDRKLASIGVYDLRHVSGPGLRYRAVPLDGVRFVPLGFDPADPAAALTPAEILERHPKGRAFARLLAGARKAPLLEDAEGGVLSMPPIINSENTRVTTKTREVLIDVTGLEDRHVEKALNIVVTSLLESSPGAYARTLEIRYQGGIRRTPDLAPQEVHLCPAETSRLIGIECSPDEVAALLRRMRHDAEARHDHVRVLVPAWRADILHPRDLMEDVAIAHGYDRMPAVALETATYGGPLPREELAAAARAALAGQGMLEVMTLALTSEEATYAKTGIPDRDAHVRLDNPISVEQTMLRVSLVPGLMETLALNLGHPYPQRIFEVGLVTTVDEAAETGAREHLHAGFALAGDGTGYADARAALDAFLREMGAGPAVARYVPLEIPLFLPGRGAEVLVGDRSVGFLGEVHPEVLERYRVVHPVAVAEVRLEELPGCRA